MAPFSHGSYANPFSLTTLPFSFPISFPHPQSCGLYLHLPFPISHNLVSITFALPFDPNAIFQTYTIYFTPYTQSSFRKFLPKPSSKPAAQPVSAAESAPLRTRPNKSNPPPSSVPALSPITTASVLSAPAPLPADPAPTPSITDPNLAVPNGTSSSVSTSVSLPAPPSSSAPVPTSLLPSSIPPTSPPRLPTCPRPSPLVAGPDPQEGENPLAGRVTTLSVDSKASDPPAEQGPVHGDATPQQRPALGGPPSPPPQPLPTAAPRPLPSLTPPNPPQPVPPAIPASIADDGAAAIEPSATAEAAPAAALAPESDSEEERPPDRPFWFGHASPQAYGAHMRAYFGRGGDSKFPSESMPTSTTASPAPTPSTSTSPASRAQQRKAAQNAARKARVKAAKARKRVEGRPGASALHWDVDDDWGDVGEGCAEF